MVRPLKIFHGSFFLKTRSRKFGKMLMEYFEALEQSGKMARLCVQDFVSNSLL